MRKPISKSRYKVSKKQSARYNWLTSQKMFTIFKTVYNEQRMTLKELQKKLGDNSLSALIEQVKVLEETFPYFKTEKIGRTRFVWVDKHEVEKMYGKDKLHKARVFFEVFINTEVNSLRSFT